MESNKIIENLKQEYKREAILSATKSFISNSKDINVDASLNKVTYSWLEDIETNEDFLEKYKALCELKQRITITGLFDLAKIIKRNDLESDEQITGVIKRLKALIKDENYSELATLAGYRIPETFLDKDSYFDPLTIEKIDFFLLFNRKIEEINSSINKKRGVSSK